MASSNEMELYAEPIPPTLAGKPQPPLSRANFREVVLRRLNAVQEQKKCLNNSPVRVPSTNSEIWKSEKDILVEMLEKTQKLQLTSQQAWSQEREDLEKQLKRVESQYRTQVDALKQDNDRLRSDLSKVKTLEEDIGTKSELTLQMQELARRHQEREEALSSQIKTLETTLVQYKEGLDKATEELEKKRFLADEQSVLQVAKAEETISALRKEVAQSQYLLHEKDESIKSMSQEIAQVRSQLETLKKKKAVKTAITQTDVRSEELTRLQSLLDDSKKELSVLKTQKDTEIASAKEETIRLSQALMTANAALRAQSVVAQSVQSSASQQDLLARLQESLEQLRKHRETCAPLSPQVSELRSLFTEDSIWIGLSEPLSALKFSITELLSRCEAATESLPRPSETEDRAKVMIELYTVSLKALLDTAREAVPSDAQALLLQVDNDKLRKERDTLLVAIQSMKSKTLDSHIETLKTLVGKVESGAKAVQGVEELGKTVKAKCCEVVTALEASVMGIKENAELEAATKSTVLSQLETLLSKLDSPISSDKDHEKRLEQIQQQKERLEDAFAKLKQMHDAELEALTQQYETYQDLVHTERGKLCDNLLKIAESVEYRQDVWEQMQGGEEEDAGQQTKELTEELERQSQWELKTLAVLMTRLQDPLQKEPPIDVNEIKEESDEDEDSETQEPVVIRLRERTREGRMGMERK